MIPTYPDPLKAQLNLIATWDEVTLQNEISRCNQANQFFSTMASVIHIASILLGLTLLVTLGMLNPFYFPITLALLMVAYHPFLSLTYHPLNDWAELAREEANKYQNILTQLQENGETPVPFEIPHHPELGACNDLFKRVIRSQYHALEAQKNLFLPQLDALRKIYSENPSEEALQNIYQAEYELCVRVNVNLHIRIREAFLVHVANHPFDQRNLFDFGSYHPLRIKYALTLRDDPIAVFLLRSGESINSQVIMSQSLNGLEERIFTPQ